MIVTEKSHLSQKICAHDADFNDAYMCHETSHGCCFKHLELVLCCRQVAFAGALTEARSMLQAGSVCWDTHLKLVLCCR